MERFIVSARKYRPDSFEALIGQDNIAITLKNSIVKKQLAHAYLFCGPRGVGKTSTARIFAKTINCFNPSEQMEPCGECESCLSFAQNRSYSIHELDGASNNSVEDIRQLNELVRIPPQIGNYSVYIIDEVHMLSQSAFNAFLKTLEEPPAHAIFILATTEKHKILATILSRCQTYDFNRISIEDIVKNLIDIAEKEEVTYEIDALHVIAAKADGAMRDALTIFDQAVAFCGKNITYKEIISSLNVLDYDYYLKLAELLHKREQSEILLLFDEILSKGFNALHFIGGLSSHFRDLLVAKESSTLTLLELPPSLITKYREQATLFTAELLYEAIGITTRCEAQYKSSGNARLLIELTLLRLSKLDSSSWREEKREAQKEVAKPEAPKPEVSKPESSIEEGKTLSIKKILKVAADNGKRGGEQRAAKIGNDPIEESKLKEVWSAMAQSESALPRLSSTIGQTTPIIKGENTILFNVINDLQKNWIEKQCKGRLVEFLRENLNNSQVTLEVEVIEEKSGEKKLYTATEKDNFLKENHPEVKKLAKDLNLEIR